jgi:hypothetical protein
MGIPKEPPGMPYVWAVLGMVALGAFFVLGILYIRPQSDPVLIIGGVAAGIAPTVAAVMSLFKSQETKIMVDGRLSSFIDNASDAAHAKGQIQGAAEEQVRMVAVTAAHVAAIHSAAVDQVRMEIPPASDPPMVTEK